MPFQMIYGSSHVRTGWGAQVRWSTAKELLVQTDGRLRELADHGEVDMNDAHVLAQFIHRGVRVQPVFGSSPCPHDGQHYSVSARHGCNTLAALLSPALCNARAPSAVAGMPFTASLHPTQSAASPERGGVCGSNGFLS